MPFATAADSPPHRSAHRDQLAVGRLYAPKTSYAEVKLELQVVKTFYFDFDSAREHAYRTYPTLISRYGTTFLRGLRTH